MVSGYTVLVELGGSAMAVPAVAMLLGFFVLAILG